MEGKALSMLAIEPMSKAELTRKLGQKKISGELNKVVRLLMADMPTPNVQANGHGERKWNEI